ncbi:hypothetical protein EYF80_063029 [Liparis tanakae]|uniref:Uncharacterized protein n=1 Tax=Liparis tanakae TaxID=230148 RepID=A0A4Z2EDN4_9TELE|nr:hypothetical protein EYF80_063029 [Liparis tanakae]
MTGKHKPPTGGVIDRTPGGPAPAGATPYLLKHRRVYAGGPMPPLTPEEGRFGTVCKRPGTRPEYWKDATNKKNSSEKQKKDEGTVKTKRIQKAAKSRSEAEHTGPKARRVLRPL